KLLLKSHFRPAALYPRKGQFELMTHSTIGKSKAQLKQYLLCGECERRFSEKGESHVLKVIAAKSMKRFPLHDLMRVAYPRESDASVSRFHPSDFNLDIDQFVYFTMTVVWRLLG